MGKFAKAIDENSNTRVGVCVCECVYVCVRHKNHLRNAQKHCK